jgi:FkbH-like protein
MVISIRLAEQKDIKRISQLTNRTNQFNLTTRRYSETDIAAMMKDKSKRVYTLSLKDKFGDNGMVGVAIVNCAGDKWDIDTFLMSCRIIGRQAEDALFDRILRDAAKQQVSKVEAEYIPTAKNKLVAEFWDRLGLTLDSENNGTKHYRLITKNYHMKQFRYFEFE